MDPLSITAAVAGFVSLTIEVTKLLKEYTSTVKGASEEAHSLLREISVLGDVLKQLEEFLRNKELDGKIQRDSALSIVISQCQDMVKRVHSSLSKLRSPSAGFREHLKWPFKKEECTEIAESLHRYMLTIECSLNVSNWELVSKTYDGLTELKNDIATGSDVKHIRADLSELHEVVNQLLAAISTKDELAVSLEGGLKNYNGQLSQATLPWQREYAINRDKYLKNLSPLQPSQRHSDMKSIRLDNTGLWIFETDAFRTWYTSQNNDLNSQILCCFGMPGAGKSVIMSAMVDYLLAQTVQYPSKGIAFLYCDYREEKDQVILNIIGSFIKQLLQGLAPDKASKDILDSLKEATKAEVHLDLQQAKDMMKLLLKMLEPCFLCIDALDELEERTRMSLFHIIKEILHSPDHSGSQLRLFLTARPNVKEQITQTLKASPIVLEIAANENDIRAYVTHQLESDPRPQAMDSQLRQMIIGTIPQKSAGMFLLASFHIDTVMQQMTVWKRHEALDTLPRNLFEVYNAIITRIRHSSNRALAELGMKVLMWTFFARTPIPVDVLGHALAVNGKSTMLETLEKNAPSATTIIESCYGLVVL
ncbi:hypothetical protein BDZ91DRAFT_685276, partial [Kalaharituber pfeilii]